MNDKLIQLDDDMLDQVSAGVSVGGTIGLDPFGQFLTEVGNALSSLPQFSWELTFGFVPGSK